MSTTITLSPLSAVASCPLGEGSSVRRGVHTTLSRHGDDGIEGVENDHIRRFSPLDVQSLSLTDVENVSLEAGFSPGPSSELSKGQTILVISTLTGITVASSISTGLITIGLPRIAKDLGLADNLLLWPASVCSLASGCTLLISGSIADFLGNRNINLIGCLLLGLLIVSSGLARTGIELIIFRALQGISVSMCFPTSFSILTYAFPNGRRRNFAFSCLGLGAPFGWSVGTFLGGFFEGSPLGWRFGFYLSGGATILLSVVNYFKLPQDRRRAPVTWRRMGREIDWIGALLSSTGLGILSYVFATITGSLSSIKETSNIVLLCISGTIVPAFIFWMNHQEKRHKPALIPNSIWKNPAFAAICAMVLLAWAVLNSMELIFSFYFQQVQMVSVIQTSIYFLPNVLMGIVLNVSTGLLVHRIRADHLVLFTSLVSAGSPLLMAVINREWSWWWCAFWAVLIGPLSADVIFTIANLIITDVFPPNTQALAGAVFNTVAQFGTSTGLTVTAVITASVTNNSSYSSKKSPDALMLGYRAVFWACFAAMIFSCGVGGLGLRKVGKVGLKRE